MQFKSLASFAAALCFALTLLWMFWPNVLLEIWAVPYSESVGIVARRCAALFAGVGVMFYVAREAKISMATVALLWGLASGCSLLAVLGVADFCLDRAGSAILLGAASEALLALVFGWAARRDALTLRRLE